VKNTAQSISSKENREITPETWLVFFEECFHSIEDIFNLLGKIEKNPKDTKLFDAIFRKVHTMKGGLSIVPNSNDLSSLLHCFESLVADFKSLQFEVEVHSIDFYYFLLTHIRTYLRDLQNEKPISSSLQEESKLLISALQKIKLQKGQLAKIKTFWHQQDLTREDEIKVEGTWISQARLENLEKLSNELIILRNLHQMFLRDEKVRKNPLALDQFSHEFAQNLSKITDQLQGQISESLNIEFAKVAHQLPRIVRQTAASCHKKVHLETFGFDLQMDRKLAQKLSEALLHMVRNSIDHGIETEIEREEMGKSPTGSLQIHLWESDGIIKVSVVDDGVGIDIDRVSEKALTQGIVSEETLRKMSRSEILKFIFHSGFTTRDAASSVSGRGVGMDVVDHFVKSFQGRIQIESNTGTGTEILLEIPVPRKVTVRKTILAQWKNIQLAFPIEDVSQIGSCENLKTTTIEPYRFIQIQNESIPLLDLYELKAHQLSQKDQPMNDGSFIVLKSFNQHLAIIVDQIDQQLEVVVRPFSGLLKKMRGFSGSAILGDDQIAYVISADDLTDLIPTQKKVA
jgi:two-component system chemotaxis sensor kinase CheA